MLYISILTLRCQYHEIFSLVWTISVILEEFMNLKEQGHYGANLSSQSSGFCVMFHPPLNYWCQWSVIKKSLDPSINKWKHLPHSVKQGKINRARFSILFSWKVFKWNLTRVFRNILNSKIFSPNWSVLYIAFWFYLSAL